jgi:hypothetical protein
MKKLGRFRIGGSSSKMKLSIPVPSCPNWRAYRYSPNTEASPRHFVLADRVRAIDGSQFDRSEEVQRVAVISGRYASEMLEQTRDTTSYRSTNLLNLLDLPSW